MSDNVTHQDWCRWWNHGDLCSCGAISALSQQAEPVACDLGKLLDANQAAITEYLKDYEYAGDGGDYLPNEKESELIMDAVQGVLSDNKFLVTFNAWQDAVRSLYTAPASVQQAEPVAEVHVILDGPPSHESGRFVECENADGKSINAGRWEQRGKYWHLIINTTSGVRKGMLRETLDALVAIEANLGWPGSDNALKLIKAHREAITRAADQVKQDAVSVPMGDVAWMRKFINCVPFGADCPSSDIERAHSIVTAMLRAAQEGKK